MPACSLIPTVAVMNTSLLTHDVTLTDGLLEAFRSRAPEHDRDGRYPADDLDDLRAIGWLGAAAPVELGGLGLNLVQLARAQRRLARFAPSTALSTCMHHYWVGLASDLRRFGLPAGTRILEWVSAGEVLASGHGEAGNDVPVSLSTARAERVTGGWRIHGRKMFGSLGPVWDRIGIHAMDTSEPAAPVVVHGFVHRNAPGVTVVPTWDAGHARHREPRHRPRWRVHRRCRRAVRRACRSVQRPGRRRHARLGVDLISNVYLGIAERRWRSPSPTPSSARRSPSRTALRPPSSRPAPGGLDVPSWTRHATVERLAQDWVDNVDHGGRWPIQVLSAKWWAATAPHARRRSAKSSGAARSPRPRTRALVEGRARCSVPPGHRCLRPRSHRQGTVGH